jgi:uncharacterized membrane protein
MAETRSNPDDKVAPDDKDAAVEQVLGNLLRVGVLLAAAVVLAGGTLYLVRHRGERSDQHYRLFRGEPADLRGPAGIVGEALALSSRGIIQLGLLILIATPVARVVLSLFAFARQRDSTYVLLTLVVLAVLLYSLFLGLLE